MSLGSVALKRNQTCAVVYIKSSVVRSIRCQYSEMLLARPEILKAYNFPFGHKRADIFLVYKVVQATTHKSQKSNSLDFCCDQNSLPLDMIF